MAIIDFFDRGWRINPQGVAYIQDGHEHGFQQVGELSCQVANGLLASGFAGQSKGAVWAKNDVAAWTCTLGLWRANLCWIPISASNAAEENHYLLETFDCEVLFFQQQFASVIAELQPRLPKVMLWICLDGDAPEVQGARSLADWTRDQPVSRPELPVDLDNVVMLSSTGGTTGKPKGVMNTHRSLQTFCAHFMLSCRYDGAEYPVNLAAAPMTHTSGILSLPCTARGGTVVIVTKPDPAVLLGAIPQYRVTEFFLPPTVIYRLLEVPGLKDKVDFSSLRYLMYGAAPMSIEKLKQAIEVFGPIMTGGYGQTECPASIAFLPPDEHFTDGRIASDERLSSVGRPNPLVRVEIMDDENRILENGATGEICVRGDLVMKGYYKAPDKTAETIIDGWLHTGDVGHIDAEGYLHITDRKKDMIISGGFNVYPSEVEQVLWGHPAVQDCAVIGVPHPEWGETVKAVVELNAGKSVTAEELVALCKEKLGSIKAPKSVDFVESLPRSPVGKVLKKDLRATYWQNSDRKI
ncbi:long-chain fatty acid--CoA ligase [Sinimarinibacterium sp. CAU 1509]|uniref:class I adenylate-forming enzyme family protein n=1 Tax=Sinimarinibacterium sp. CAU 1509 TaxID=2562283 RepID=UPI0010AD2BC1|nr:AMP-binding protein [Sinimarinibacterium sp. CAU 1509]TJY58392.1 long-chain fatty acid--CoA ligase [Sinimarinibacterium sp. CAU 1509]